MDKKPGPWRITFDTNPDHCNLRCVMCEDHSPYSTTRKDRVKARIPKRVMNFELIRNMLDSAQGTPLREIIPSTMGEPLLYRNFDGLIDLCHQYQLKLNLTTNGTFPIKGAEAWAKRLVPVTSDVKVSWNGASKQTQEDIMLGANWESMLDNLKTFIRVRDEHAKNKGNYCSVTLQLTFLESNVNELADIVQLGIDLGVNRIKGHHLWAHFKEISGLSMRRNSKAIAHWNKAVIKAQAVAKKQKLPNGEYIKLANIYTLDEHAATDLMPEGKCPFLGEEAWIATDGRFNPCCAPDKLRRQLGDFGSLQEKTLTEIWKGDAYQNLQENYLDFDLCKSCNMKVKDVP